MKYWADNYLNSLLLSLVWQLNPWQSTFTHNERGGSLVWMWESENINMICVFLSKHDECITPSPRGRNYPFLLTAAREQFVLKLARVSAGTSEGCQHHVNKYRPCLHKSEPIQSPDSRSIRDTRPLCPRRLMFRVSRVMPGMMVNQKILFIARSIDD